jgi:hypothetical protein
MPESHATTFSSFAGFDKIRPLRAGGWKSGYRMTAA